MSSLYPILLLALISSPIGEVSEAVDLIELNHFYDEKAAPVYDQVVFYQWSEARTKFLVRGWCLIEPNSVLARRPMQSPHDGRMHVRWFDSDQKLFRHLHSELYQETWTQTDPERANKKLLDERHRLTLYKVPDPDKKPTVSPVEESSE